MRYAMMIYIDPAGTDHLSEEEGRAVSQEYYDLRALPGMFGGGHLGPIETATTVRGENLLTDGPFADTKEVFGGFYLYEADDLDAALEVAKRVPAVRFGGAVEVRPLV
jgi:hypothetical protein